MSKKEEIFLEVVSIFSGKFLALVCLGLEYLLFMCLLCAKRKAEKIKKKIAEKRESGANILGFYFFVFGGRFYLRRSYHGVFIFIVW